MMGKVAKGGFGAEWIFGGWAGRDGESRDGEVGEQEGEGEAVAVAVAIAIGNSSSNKNKSNKNTLTQ